MQQNISKPVASDTGKPTHHSQPVIFLRISQVVDRTAVPRSSLYRKIANGDFPKPFRLGKKSVAWRSDEVQEWINNREIA